MDVNTFSGKYYRAATLTKSYPTVTGIIITVMDVQTLISLALRIYLVLSLVELFLVCMYVQYLFLCRYTKPFMVIRTNQILC